MKIKLNLLLPFLFTIIVNYSYGQNIPIAGGDVCIDAAPICTSEGQYTWPCGTSGQAGEIGPNYGCLGSQPNVAWYYFQIEEQGEIVMSLSANSDVDFIIWGPFDNPICNYDSLSTENIIDCSYTSTTNETPEIGPNSSGGPTTAIASKYYMILITNYSQATQDFTFEQTNTGELGAGSTNCDIVCPLMGMSLLINNCEFSQNGNNYYTTYDISCEIEFDETIAIDSFVVEIDEAVIQTYYSPLNSPILFGQNNLSSDGLTNIINVTAYKSNGEFCNIIKSYIAPKPIHVSCQNTCQNSDFGSVIINMDSYASYNNFFEWNTGEEEQINSGIYINDSLVAGSYSVTITSDYNSACNYIIDDILIENMGTDCSIVSGNIYADVNDDCNYNINDVLIPNVILQFDPLDIYTISDEFGFYSVNLPYGDYTINEGGYNNIIPSCSVSQPLELSLDNATPLLTFDIANEDNGFSPDLGILSYISISRPGFGSGHCFYVKNHSSIAAENIEIGLKFDTILDYDNTFFLTDEQSPYLPFNYENISLDSINYIIPSLEPFEIKKILVSFLVPNDIELLGDTLYSMVRVSLSGGVDDSDMSNNSSESFRIIQGAYDPNFVEINNIPNQEEVYLKDSTLTYTIHFQNTGTDTAFNVVVVDTIPEKLDLLTFVAGPSSHPYTYKIENGRKLKFTFDNILLPDSNVNESQSHGFVTFNIRQNESNQIGDFINCKSEIYFDFNPAVITELLETEIVDSIVEVKKINSLSTFRIIPNPAKNIILVSFEKQNTGTIQIFNLSGQIVFEEGYLNQKELKISVQDLKKGIYIVRNKEENIIETTKFLVE